MQFEALLNQLSLDINVDHQINKHVYRPLCSRLTSSGFLYGLMASKWMMRSRSGLLIKSGLVSTPLP